jgi:hypothetical protein
MTFYTLFTYVTNENTYQSGFFTLFVKENPL